MSWYRSRHLFALTVALVACSSSETSVNGGGSSGAVAPVVPCKADAECTGTAATPLCTASVCAALPPGHEIGYRDGVPATVRLTEIFAAPAAAKLTDLAFHSERTDELWTVGYGDNALYRGSRVGTDAPTFDRILDPASGHFMFRPPAIAMGTPAFFGTCGDNLNERGGGDGSNAFFMGPALFSTDPAIIGIRTAGGLGSHMDMLHNTPLCRGIAWVSDNIYWVFNGFDHSLDKYNFNKDHGPGGDDHADGTIFRYAMGDVKGVEDGTPSHVFFDPVDKFLYVADTGNARIVRLDTTKGTKGASLARQMEPLADEGIMNGTAVEVVVAAGVLTKPSGLEMRGGLLYVTDTATSTFHVFDKTGHEVRRLEVDLPAGSLAGVAFGPDDKLYFADKVASKIVRLDPQ